jgi:acyl-CoA synthetase (AMP-forming)/AMP-acid ligase II
MTSNMFGERGRRAGSVGFGQGVEVRIYDEKSAPGASDLGYGVEGEVCVRGTNVTPGYLNNPAANARAYIPQPDGAAPFFRTGDRGYLELEDAGRAGEKRARLTLVGRISEIINRGGEKISPIEVDAVLLGAHPAIIEGVSFAVPDELLGQEVEAAVVLDKAHPDVVKGGMLTEAKIQELVMLKLAEFKVPKRVHFCEGAIPKGESAVPYLPSEERTWASRS